MPPEVEEKSENITLVLSLLLILLLAAWIFIETLWANWLVAR